MPDFHLIQSSLGEEHMDILSTLRNERSRIAVQLDALDTAIRALSGNTTHASRGPRRMSAAARARISASQKARWARTRGQKVMSIAPKRRRISAAGLANIRAAQRARWAKVKSQQKVVSIAPKRHISAAGLARIRSATKARWARWRQQKRSA